MNSPKDTDFFCSIQSREIDEPLLGSAPTAQIWMMLEYEGKWNKKAFKESGLSEEIKSKFNEEVKAIDKTRLLLIKQKKKEKGAKSFFVALPNKGKAPLLKFSFDDYEELLELDLVDIVDNPGKYEKNRIDESILLICTKGLRDKCCALNGAPVYQQLDEEFGQQIWQSTHHGSHRFSANMLFMPEALSFGQIDMGNPKEIVNELLQAKVALPHFRGRSRYSKIAQAAEGLLLSEIGSSMWKSLTFVDDEELEGGQWKVHFRNSNDGKEFQIRIKSIETDKMVFASCIGEKQVPVIKYELIALDVI